MTEVIPQLRNIYKEHLFTDEGRKNLEDAVELKKQWKEECERTDCRVTTAGVKPNLLPKVLRDKTTCIEINPIGLNNCCHITSELFAKSCKGLKVVLGYNITACNCGRLMSLEIHSVNKIGNKLYDFTRDFNDEKSKYFAEIDTKLTARLHNNIFSNKPITINKGCKCPFRWSMEYLMSDGELEERIEEIESIEVLETDFGYLINHKNK
jgi:hypothetical protein